MLATDLILPLFAVLSGAADFGGLAGAAVIIAKICLLICLVRSVGTLLRARYA